MWCIKVSQAFAFLTLKSLPSHKIETMLFQNNMILQIVNLGLHMIYIYITCSSLVFQQRFLTPKYEVLRELGWPTSHADSRCVSV